VKLYDRSGGALRHVRDWRGHRGPISSLSFPLPCEAPAVALTSSADGTACFWDARAPGGGPAARFAAPGGAAAGELCAAALGGAGGTLLAAAGDAGVVLWDRRGGGAAPPLATFTEAHADPVTAVAFHPERTNVCLFAMHIA
jgi:WD40 repeat protein